MEHRIVHFPCFARWQLALQQLGWARRHFLSYGRSQILSLQNNGIHGTVTNSSVTVLTTVQLLSSLLKGNQCPTSMWLTEVSRLRWSTFIIPVKIMEKCRVYCSDSSWVYLKNLSFLNSCVVFWKETKNFLPVNLLNWAKLNFDCAAQTYIWRLENSILQVLSCSNRWEIRLTLCASKGSLLFKE